MTADVLLFKSLRKPSSNHQTRLFESRLDRPRRLNCTPGVVGDIARRFDVSLVPAGRCQIPPVCFGGIIGLLVLPAALPLVPRCSSIITNDKVLGTNRGFKNYA